MAVTLFIDSGPLTYLSVLVQCSGAPVASNVTAEDYLRFAKSDLEAETAHGLINAMGNAKRSLHLMIDTVLQNYGLLVHSKRRSFSDKLRVMDDLGLVALNVFRKLNVERNAVEHDYIVPDPDRVQDFVDVCHLLLLAIERLGQDIPYRSIVGIRETGEHLLMVLEPLLGTIEFRPLVTPTLQETEVYGSKTQFVVGVMGDAGRVPDSESIGGVVRSIELRRGNEDEWVPLVRSLAAARTKLSSSRVSVVKDGTMILQAAVIVPMTDGIPLADLINARLGVGPAVRDAESP